MASSAGTNSPLLPVTGDSTRNPKWKFFRVTCCVKSKAARLVLLWNFAVLLAYRMLYNIDMVMQVRLTSLHFITFTIALTFIAVFSPVAGLLTDIRFSRYRAGFYSSWFIILKVMFVIVFVILTFIGYYSFFMNISRSVFLAPLLAMLAVFVTIYVIFIINVFQFGIDQLHDSPTEDSILFILHFITRNSIQFTVL